MGTVASRPSAQLGRLDAAEAETFERVHGESPKTLQYKLAGDLDWITMKAMDKDRARRYDSPIELSADIQRYLDFEPVVARPTPTVPPVVRSPEKQPTIAMIQPNTNVLATPSVKSETVTVLMALVNTGVEMSP